MSAAPEPPPDVAPGGAAPAPPPGPPLWVDPLPGSSTDDELERDGDGDVPEV